MHDFVSHILRQYFIATHWNEYNSYLHLTSSSSSILDFPVPTGLSLSISASPTPPFFTTYRLGALPNLRAGIGYIYASTRNEVDFGRSSKDVRLKEVIERFRIVEAPPRRSSVKGKQREREYYWLAGERFEIPPLDAKVEEGGEYLVYGCMHVPSARLDALWTKRISPTWQLILTAVSTPPKYPLNALQSAALATQSSFTSAKSTGMTNSVDRLESSTHTLASSSSTIAPQQSTPTATAEGYGLGPPGSTNLQLTLQRDTGRWFTEYSYSIDDALWGFRVLHNFGAAGEAGVGENSVSSAVETASSATTTLGSVSGNGDLDTDAVGGGLRGRFSAGAEVFISTVEKSAGLSTGIRFSTLPDSPILTPPDANPTSHSTTGFDNTTSSGVSAPSQPPTVITATLNPMMGHLSTAYAARMARDVVVCSRFDFNVYSYESEWTVGAEYWLRRSPTTTAGLGSRVGGEKVERGVSRGTAQGGGMSLRNVDNRGVLDGSQTPTSPEEGLGLSLRPPPAPPSFDTPAPSSSPPSMISTLLAPITGVLKARLSTTSDIRLLWQGRLSHCLVSLGVKADLSPPPVPSASRGVVKSIGLEVMYFSSADVDE